MCGAFTPLSERIYAIITGATNAIANVFLCLCRNVVHIQSTRQPRKHRKKTENNSRAFSYSSFFFLTRSCSCSCFCSVYHFASVFHFYVYLVILCNYLTFIPLFTHHRRRRLVALAFRDGSRTFLRVYKMFVRLLKAQKNPIDCL